MSNHLLARFEAIQSTSQQMLAAAKRQDWHEVSRLEEVCEEQVTELKAQQTDHPPLSAVEQARKQRALLAILRHDAQIRSLAEPWMANLSHLLGTGRGQRQH